MLLFGALGPIIRRKCPEGFVLTEWTRQRYGTVAMLYLGFLTLVTLFLYMVAELSALGQVIGALTGLDKLPVIIVQCVVTTIYTCESRFSACNRGRLLIGRWRLLSARRLQNLLPHRRHPGRHGGLPHHSRHH